MRFTNIEKWKDAWFSKLSPHEKLLFFYIIENCDLAGFLEVDYRMISFLTGMKEDEILGAFKGLLRGYLGAKNTGWIWIKNFLKHQKNLPLNPENNAHKHIIYLIENQKQKFGNPPEMDTILPKLGAKEGLHSPIGKVRYGKGKVKVFLIPLFDKFDFNGYTEIKEPVLQLAKTLDEKYPEVMSMKVPFNPEDLCRIVKKYDSKKIMDVIRGMENYTQLHKKNKSAYLTCINWLEKRENDV